MTDLRKALTALLAVVIFAFFCQPYAPRPTPESHVCASNGGQKVTLGDISYCFYEKEALVVPISHKR